MKPRIIQCDDSGWGSLLGGVCIGVYDTACCKMYARMIPVSFFQGGKFESRQYLNKALEIFKSGLQRLTNNSDSDRIHIQICRGFMLSKIRSWVEQNKESFAKVEYTKIKDPFQSILEHKFSTCLGKIGVPGDEKSGAHRLSFDDMIEWVKEDKSRIKYVKTGWKSWINKYSLEMS